MPDSVCDPNPYPDYRGKRHDPLPSEWFIGTCSLCGADIGHWWHWNEEVLNESHEDYHFHQADRPTEPGAGPCWDPKCLTGEA